MDVPLVYSLLFYFSFKESLWTIHPCVQGFYSSVLVCLSWITLNECTKMKDFHTIMYILENTSHIYIYIKIQTYANIRPQAWHMLERELKIHTNASMNSTKVKTLMYFLGDY